MQGSVDRKGNRLVKRGAGVMLYVSFALDDQNKSSVGRICNDELGSALSAFAGLTRSAE